MPYDFSTRLDYNGTRMKQLHQNSLVYSRKTTAGVIVDTVTIANFTPERIDVNSLAAYGLTLITDKSQGFVFDTASLAAFNPPEPKVRDEIVWDGRTYNVSPIGDQNNAECFRFVTSTRLRIRIYTKQII